MTLERSGPDKMAGARMEELRSKRLKKMSEFTGNEPEATESEMNYEEEAKKLEDFDLLEVLRAISGGISMAALSGSKGVIDARTVRSALGVLGESLQKFRGSDYVRLGEALKSEVLKRLEEKAKNFDEDKDGLFVGTSYHLFSEFPFELDKFPREKFPEHFITAIEHDISDSHNAEINPEDPDEYDE